MRGIGIRRVRHLVEGFFKEALIIHHNCSKCFKPIDISCMLSSSCVQVNSGHVINKLERENVLHVTKSGSRIGKLEESRWKGYIRPHSLKHHMIYVVQDQMSYRVIL